MVCFCKIQYQYFVNACDVRKMIKCEQMILNIYMDGLRFADVLLPRPILELLDQSQQNKTN